MTVLIEAVPLELHVDDAGVSELVVALVFRHGAECRAAEVEVEAGDRVVVHVRDDHRLRHPRARRVHTRQAPYLVAGAAAFAVLEERLVAAGCHGGERGQVHVLETAGPAIVVGAGAVGRAVPRRPRVHPPLVAGAGRARIGGTVRRNRGRDDGSRRSRKRRWRVGFGRRVVRLLAPAAVLGLGCAGDAMECQEEAEQQSCRNRGGG